MKTFLVDEAGGITVDYVSLIAGILLLAIPLIYSIFSNGVSPLSLLIQDELSQFDPEIDVGTAPQLNP
ncbi:MAG: hypothetical protein AAFV19_21190 [Pseudomonadota bacterium]